MLPPVETNYDIVVHNSLTPSANLVYNLGQKDLRYSTVWCDNLACSNLFFHDNGVFVGSFSGSYNDLRDKPAGGVGSTPEYYEKLSFFPDKSLTLTAQSNSVIAGLNLQTTGTQVSYFRADRLVCTEMSCLNGPISQVGTPELSHQAANKGYVDSRFVAYTPTEQMNFHFEALYAKKSDLQTTDLRMLTLLRNISQSAIPDPFAFLDYNVTFLFRQTTVGIFNKSIVYHFDPIASWSFDPPLLYLDTTIGTLVMPEVITEWTIGVMSIPDLLARGYSIQRGHALDTIERRRAAVDQFTDRKWNYLSLGPPDYHEYPPPPPPPSLPPTIPVFICAPFFISIVVGYTVADDVEIQQAYAELSAASSGLLLDLKQAVDLPSGALEFLNLTPGEEYIVKMVAVDTNFNMTSREEYVSIADITAPTINQFITYNMEAGSITVGVDVTDDSGRAVAIAYLYWKEDPNNELDSWGIPLTNGVGNATFTGLVPGRTYIVELLVRDAAWNSTYDSRERAADGGGIGL